MAFQTVMKAASDPTRRAILNLLKKGSLSAGDISKHFNMSQPAISQHLALLREAELVTCRRQGRSIIYELNASAFEEVLFWIQDLIGERHEQTVHEKQHV